jgi:pyruvate dehydrogenase E1 component beta subunit
MAKVAIIMGSDSDLPVMQEAARILEEEHGISAEVVDLRTIRPLDEETILNSVAKTHRAVYVEENKPYCGIGAQIAYMIQERIFDELDAPVGLVSPLRHRCPTPKRWR